jgi:hypothetical protein
MFTIPSLVVMDSTSVFELAKEIQVKLILAEERYSLAASEDVEQAEREYLALEEVAMGLARVIRYLNEQSEQAFFNIVEKKRENLKDKA